MPLLGQAAMLLAFDVAPEAIDEHDDWHSHEHLPERLSIPGFLRGTRWVAQQGKPRYFVLYEVARLDVLTSRAYLQRLDNPSPWTSKMMPHYRAMSRGFCSVTGSFGAGVGHAASLIRFRPGAQAAALREWLLREALPELPSRRGVVGAHLLEGALTPPMTVEQRIRGADAGVDWAVLVTGYGDDAAAALALAGPAGPDLARRGAAEVAHAVYRIDCALAHDETGA
jgi:hypothetical protein